MATCIQRHAKFCCQNVGWNERNFKKLRKKKADQIATVVCFTIFRCCSMSFQPPCKRQISVQQSVQNKCSSLLFNLLTKSNAGYSVFTSKYVCDYFLFTFWRCCYSVIITAKNYDVAIATTGWTDGNLATA